MTTYTPAELHARLEQISTDPSWSPLLRSMARCADAGLPGYEIQPADLSDKAISATLLAGIAARAALPAPPPVDLDRLRALLTEQS